MSILTTILTILAALECFFILYLETIATTSAKTSKVFNMDQEELKRASVQSLFKNQGVYNGLLGVGLLYGAFFASNPKEMVAAFLIYMILAALYGAVTVDKKIILKQGGVAILALLSLFVLA